MDKTNQLENYFDCPFDFPIEDFNKKLGEILKDAPKIIKEKDLQDNIYDILEKKGTLLGMHIYKIFNVWPETIEKIMLFKQYHRSDLDPGTYVSSQSS